MSGTSAAASSGSTTSVRPAAARFAIPDAAQRLAASWIGDENLDGWTPSSLLVALTKREHPDHDVLMRGLETRSTAAHCYFMDLFVRASNTVAGTVFCGSDPSDQAGKAMSYLASDGMPKVWCTSTLL